jgi:hypothetical protein
VQGAGQADLLAALLVGLDELQPDIERALAAHDVALDDGHPLAAPLGQAAGGDLAGRPAASDVEFAFHVMSPRLLVVTEGLFM